MYKLVSSEYKPVHTSLYLYVLGWFCDEQAYAKNCSGYALLDINLLKPSIIEFAHEPAPLLAMSETQASLPQWLEYFYRTAHPVLRWLPTKLVSLRVVRTALQQRL